ncbi:hypothetical protein JTE90_026631 [Oedothorax gibbosus]|uniref:Splicing factor YJU2 n=1 Tax=Oedothorax gibbosus TaxID=931172 RepID=A0AAV6U781_9ARAC|nr:hypothetical protein JTE90_026631 [Oedothorax gibbosus]
MSERKVLNKYYPPDFDPSKIPRLRLSRDRQYTVRLMAPCNMKCTTCGEYIYKGKKFNARKETVQNEEYLGIKVFRFYIKCPRCLAEITFKTDPENADYIVEHGATRNFQALKLAEEAAAKEAKELEEEEKNNPMKLLENRTQASKQEMELMETLEELKDLNQRHAKVDLNHLLVDKQQQLVDELKRQEEEDEQLVRTYFGKSGNRVKRIIEDDDEPETKKKIVATEPKRENINSLLETSSKAQKLSSASIGILSAKSKSGLVKLKKNEPSISTEQKPISQLTNTVPPSSSNSLSITETKAAPNALSLLGSYSDSDDST